MKKYYIKKNLISFVIGLILFGSIGVYAAVTFQSNKIAYNNKTSGVASENVQGAIDELYKICTAIPPGDVILDSEEIKTSGDGLYKDEYEENRYVYKGIDVNNYITFNNETWRIISIEPNKTIKIMRNDSIENRMWDSKNSNKWDKPADINTYLNETYYNNLSDIAKTQIIDANYNIGAVAYNDNNLSNTISKEKASTWNGKVGLINASDYIRSNTNVESCNSMNLIWSNTGCGYTTWMHNNTSWWTITPYSGSANIVFGVDAVSYFIRDGKANRSFGIRPSVYLSSYTQITGGNGTQNNPYTIS